MILALDSQLNRNSSLDSKVSSHDMNWSKSKVCPGQTWWIQWKSQLCVPLEPSVARMSCESRWARYYKEFFERNTLWIFAMKFLLNASGFFTVWRLPCAFWPWVAQVGSPSSYRYLPPYSFLPLQRQSVRASNIFNFSACWRFPSPIVKSKHQIEILENARVKKGLEGERPSM